MNTQKFFTHPVGVLLAAVFATFLWGSAFPFIKRSYTALDIAPHEVGEQLLFAGYRFFLAGLLVLLFFRLLGKRMTFQPGTAGTVIKIGLFQTFLQYVCFYIGLSMSTGIQGAIISGTSSFFQIGLAHFMYKDDSFTVRKAAGILLGLAGVVLVNMTKGELRLDFGWGELLLLMAALLYSYGNILAKEGSRSMDVGYLTAYQMLFGSLGLLLAGAVKTGLFPFHFTGAAIGMLLYLSFLSAAGFLIWNTIMKYNKVGKVSMYICLIPVFGVMLSSLLLGEQLHWFVLLGLGAAAAGIIIVNQSPGGKRSAVKKVS
ncbi:DMT family transporter [Ectobacillus ponti]|uniref:DMT family transporter n=1 Tax=Ectobacillus ponti TaxID=2961894 RepID=A0AA41X6L3_9BACI|nr:DMT family transporter [Ectobacillus ponti]MCP8969899.1 DMT family transporter [Ectobacillus ponti]